MPRNARLFITGAIYHVYCRAARGESVSDATTIHRWLCVGHQLQRSDPTFRARIDPFDSAISNQDNDNATIRYVAT